MAGSPGTGTAILTVDTSGYTRGMQGAQAQAVKTGQAAATASKVASGGWAQAAKALNQNQLVSQLETVTALFIQVGGSVSQVASIATSAIRPVALLASTVGGVTLAALAVPAAFAASGLAISAAAASASEARDRLVELGVAVGADVNRDLAAYAAGQKSLAIAIDEVKVNASGLAAEVGVLSRVVADNVGWIAREIDAGAQLAGILGNTITLGAAGAVKAIGTDWYNALTESTRATQDAEIQTQAYHDVLVTLAKQQEAVAKAAKSMADTIADQDMAEGARQQAAADKQAAAAKAAAAKQEQIDNAISAQQREEALAQMDREIAATAQLRANMQAFGQLNLQIAATRDAAIEASEEIAAMLNPAIAMWDAAAANAEVRTTEMRDGILNLTASLASSLSDVFGAIGDHVADQIADIRSEGDKLAEHNMELREKVQQIRDEAYESERGQLNAVDEANIENLQNQIENNNELMKSNDAAFEAKKKAAVRAFNAEKAANIAAIAANAAVALITAFAQVGPIGEPFAAAAILAAATASAGIVAAQKPPEYPMGRMGRPSPDHEWVGARADEPILPARAKPLIGGDAGVARLLAGQSPGAGVVQVYLGSRLIAEQTGSGPSRPVDPRRGTKPSRRR